MRTRLTASDGFVLHTYPYSETSLVVEMFLREHGRMPVLVRGARRPRSPQRGLFIPFQPIEVSCSASGEVKTLYSAEWCAGLPLLTGRALILGYYVNELILALVPREDPHPDLFDAYVEALRALAAELDDGPDLRRFELSLLRELGYGVVLDHDVSSGARVDGQSCYQFVLERGPVACAEETSEIRISGQTLLDMAAGEYDNPVSRSESKLLMRRLITHHLEGRELVSRRIFRELQNL